MARTSLSLAALGTACGTAADLAACAGNSSVASMEDFAIDNISGIAAESSYMEPDGMTVYYFYPTGANFGSKFMSKIASRGANVTWSLYSQDGMFNVSFNGVDSRGVCWLCVYRYWRIAG